jgi:hypothetical protein
MNERLIDKIDRIAKEAGIKEVTPSIRLFALLIRKDQCDTIDKLLLSKEIRDNISELRND